MVDKKIEMYKALLVTEAYSQKPSFDYEETFLPVAMLNSIRILPSIMAHLDYKMW